MRTIGIIAAVLWFMWALWGTYALGYEHGQRDAYRQARKDLAASRAVPTAASIIEDNIITESTGTVVLYNQIVDPNWKGLPPP